MKYVAHVVTGKALETVPEKVDRFVEPLQAPRKVTVEIVTQLLNNHGYTGTFGAARKACQSAVPAGD